MRYLFDIFVKFGTLRDIGYTTVIVAQNFRPTIVKIQDVAKYLSSDKLKLASAAILNLDFGEYFG